MTELSISAVQPTDCTSKFQLWKKSTANQLVIPFNINFNSKAATQKRFLETCERKHTRYCRINDNSCIVNTVYFTEIIVDNKVRMKLCHSNVE